MTLLSGPFRGPIRIDPHSHGSAVAPALAGLRSRVVPVAIGGCVLAGLALRLLAARGDLWLDELWSLDLVSSLRSPDQVFWKISHDNNHFLNSLWMYAVGQHRDAFVYRLPSVVFGTLAILAAAVLGLRVNAAAGIAAAAMTACSYPFVDYGSEARGYGGLILATLIATGLGQTLVDRLCRLAAAGRASETRDRWLLGATVALGTCAHLTMVITPAILGLAAVVRLTLAGRTIPKAIDATFVLFKPALILLLPVVGALGAGVLTQGEFTVGGGEPFTLAGFVTGYGGMLGVILGLGLLPAWVGLVATTGLLGAAFALNLLDRRWIVPALVAFALWPAFLFAIRMKNTEFSRYFLASGLFLAVFVPAIVGRLWAAGGARRIVGAALMVVVCLGQAPVLAELVIDHRGSPAAAVAFMAADGPALYRARNPAVNRSVISTYAERQGVSVTPDDPADFCRHPADWIVYDTDYGESAPDTPELGPASCRKRYAKARIFPAALWSGRAWTLYRRLP